MHTKKADTIAKGSHKAEMVEKAILGPVITDIPASIVQMHPNCEILLNADAGARIVGSFKYLREAGTRFYCGKKI